MYKACELVYGNKERQRDSVLRLYRGDYINAGKNKVIRSVLKKHEDYRVFFAEKLLKLNDSGKLQPRTVVVTQAALYVVDDSSSLPGPLGGLLAKVSRRTPLTAIVGVTLSVFADNIVVIHVTGEPDFVFDSERKTELAGTLWQLHRDRNKGALLPVNFTDKVKWTAKEKKQKEIQWVKDDKLPKQTVKANKDTVVVAVPTGLPKDAGHSRKKAASAPPAPPRSINRAGVAKGPEAKWHARATQDYVAQNARELTFKKGEVINVTSRPPTGLWQGELRGQRGVFPASYCELMP